MIQNKLLSPNFLGEGAGHDRGGVASGESLFGDHFDCALSFGVDAPWNVCVRGFVDEEGGRGAKRDDRRRVMGITKDDDLA